MHESFQSRFEKVVVHRSDVETEFATATVKPAGLLNGAQGAFEVYRRAYRARLTESLGDTYDAVWSVLEDALFFEACRRYIEITPSTSYSLSDYGQSFPEFLAREAHVQELPFLPDLARFELAFSEIFHKPQHVSLPVTEFAAQVDSPGARLVFGSVILFESAYGVYEIWKHRDELHTYQQSDVNKGIQLMMYKSAGKVFVRPFPRAEFELLQRLGHGMRLSEIGTDAGQDMTPEGVCDLFSFIAASGIVTAVD